MPPFYFVPDSDSGLLSDHSRDGSVYFRGGRDLPDDIHWRCLCHLCCRYLSEGRDWGEVPGMLHIENAAVLADHFTKYTGMDPLAYGEWCRRRRGI